ncbi:MAG: hypothetical protein ACPGC3_08100 [Paracoccaceae bacterium]
MTDLIKVARNITLGDIIGAAMLAALAAATMHAPDWWPVVAEWME